MGMGPKHEGSVAQGGRKAAADLTATLFPLNARAAAFRLLCAGLLCLAVVMTAVIAGPSAPRAETPEADKEGVIAAALAPEGGDLDDIIARGMLRMAIPYNPIYFSYDGEKMIGFAVERAREFETFLKEKTGKRIDVILVPLPRDLLLDALIEGAVDIVAANLTITPARQERVAFSEPILSDVAELVVTGPAAGKIETFDDLAKVGLYLRPSSSYYGHAEELSDAREAEGRQRIPLYPADERLEDFDLLDMLNAGTVAAIVVDHHKLELWTEVFEHIRVHEDLALNRGGEIAWALRHDNPKLLARVNDFLTRIREGSLVGNILINRYLGSSNWIEDIREGVDLDNYETVTPVIQKYAGEYGFDWRMIFAQAYQESKLDQSKKSAAGAVGIMQVLPTTAADDNVGIPNISGLENNVHAGVRYLRFLRDRYFRDQGLSPLDEVLFSLAAYNAGRANIARAQKMAETMGLDPKVWFSNVEVAAARSISREPVVYVRNIYKYYVSLSLMDLRDAHVNAPSPLPISVREPADPTQPEAQGQASSGGQAAEADAPPAPKTSATYQALKEKVASGPPKRTPDQGGLPIGAYVTPLAVLLALAALFFLRRRRASQGG